MLGQEMKNNTQCIMCLTFIFKLMPNVMLQYKKEEICENSEICLYIGSRQSLLHWYY